MEGSKLIVALIVIIIVGFSVLGYSMYSLYNSVQNRVSSLNSTIVKLSNSTNAKITYEIAGLASKVGSLSSSLAAINGTLSNKISTLEKRIGALSSSSSYFPVTIMSATNTSVTIPSYPKRIVSLDPATTEILIAIGAGKQLVGVDNASLHYLPPRFENELKGLYKSGNVTNIGNTYSGVDVEKVLSLRPNLVIGTYQWGFSSLSNVLKDYGIPVLLLPSYTSLNDLYTAIIMVGRATGHVKSAVSLVENMSSQLSYLKALVGNSTKQNISYLLWINPTYVTGSDTFQSDMIMLSGNENAFKNITKWGVISPEEMLKANPSIIIVTGGSFNESNLISWLKKTIGNAYENISAIKHDKVYFIKGYYVDYINEPGPMVVKGVELLIAITHPSLLNITKVPSIITPSDFPLPTLVK